MEALKDLWKKISTCGDAPKSSKKDEISSGQKDEDDEPKLKGKLQKKIMIDEFIICIEYFKEQDQCLFLLEIVFFEDFEKCSYSLSKLKQEEIEQIQNFPKNVQISSIQYYDLSRKSLSILRLLLNSYKGQKISLFNYGVYSMPTNQFQTKDIEGTFEMLVEKQLTNAINFDLQDIESLSKSTDTFAKYLIKFKRFQFYQEGSSFDMHIDDKKRKVILNICIKQYELERDEFPLVKFHQLFKQIQKIINNPGCLEYEENGYLIEASIKNMCDTIYFFEQPTPGKYTTICKLLMDLKSDNISRFQYWFHWKDQEVNYESIPEEECKFSKIYLANDSQICQYQAIKANHSYLSKNQLQDAFYVINGVK